MTTRLLTSLVISSPSFVISPISGAQLASDTSGFGTIGVGIALSSASALLINSALSSKTTPESGNRIDPSFPVYVKNINLGKHGSDSGAYDNNGRFVPEKFEDIFRKYAKSNTNALTSNELDEVIDANRDPNDIQGCGVEGFLLGQSGDSLHVERGQGDALLQKYTVRAVYDGTLFWELEKQHKKDSLGVKPGNWK